MAKDAKEKKEGVCVVRNVHITVEVKVSQRFLISKKTQETVEEMFLRMKDEQMNVAAKRDCDICRTITQLVEECNGEVSNVVSNYNGKSGRFIVDMYIDFVDNDSTQEFCHKLYQKAKSI